MRGAISLPMGRVTALANEMGKSAELAVADLLSVLCSRKMWAHLKGWDAQGEAAVFVYGDNVPTPRARRAK